MNSIDEKYNNMLQGNEDFEKVGWGSHDSQLNRFRIITGIGDLSECSVLDVGCGLGAFLKYAQEIYPNLLYTGSDINPKMITGAIKRHPKAEFINTDITSSSSELRGRKFDYVFLSGALNLTEDKHDKNIREMMEAMFKLAKKGVAINFLSIFSDYLTPGEYYSNPEVILRLAFSISPKVVLRHDYMKHDFTLYLYK